MATYHGTSKADDITGLQNEANVFIFDTGQMSKADYIAGSSDSDFIDRLEFSGVVNLTSTSFGTVVGIELIRLEDGGDNTLVIPDALAAASNRPGDELTIQANSGDDNLNCSLVTSTNVDLQGQGGNDTLTGGDGADTLTGSIGDDVLFGGLGIDHLDGFSDFDTASGTTAQLHGDSFNSVEKISIYSSGALTISLSSSITDIVLHSFGNDLTFSGGANVTGSNVADEIAATDWQFGGLKLNGNGGNDTITANASNDTLTGGSGVDVLNGSGGNDVLDGGSSGDLLTGGKGDDTYKAIESGDLIFELNGGGIDTIETAIASVALLANIENVTYTGTLAFTGTGNGLANKIIGKGGADTIEGIDGGDNLIGNGGDDDLIGGGGNDTLIGGNGEDSLSGGSGNDSIQGLGHRDIIYGWAGLDVLEGGTGNDSIYGGSQSDSITGAGGNDLLKGEAGADWISGGEGADTIEGGIGADTASYGGSLFAIDADLRRLRNEVVAGTIDDDLIDVENIVGTSFNDIIRGNELGNYFSGSGGRDTMWGFDGDDVLDGGTGFDRYHPGAGDDTVQGAPVEEVIYAESLAAITAIYDTKNLVATASGADIGNDMLIAINMFVGGAGNDTIGYFYSAHGGEGDDWFIGDSNVTAFHGDNGFDTVYYETSGPYIEPLVVDLESQLNNRGHARGDDLHSIENVATGGGEDTLYGDNQGNRLSGGGNIDFLYGREGSDTLDGGEFSDFLYGEEDFDTADYSGSWEGVSVNLVTNFNEGGTAFADYLDSVEWIVGSAFADTISGDGEINKIEGEDGDDVLSGVDGHDSLIGGTGADTMRGGTGDDYYGVDSVGDVVDESLSNGHDTVESNVSFTLPFGVEDLELYGSESVDAIGNELDNVLSGNNASNVLNGLFGADTMTGADGDDTYYVNNTGDVVTEIAGQGLDTVRSGITATLALNVENLVLVGTNATNGTGNGLANTLTGNGAGNVLDGRGGADTMGGGAGADTFAFATALGASNIDYIGTFNVADDTIRLENAVFTGLAAGALAATAFVTGATAADAADRIIYNSATGALLFDADGTGATAAIQFATLSAGLALTSADFTVV